MVTFLLSLLAIAGICLMLFSAVALVQGDMVASVAPKEAQPLIQPKAERFKGQHIIGWILLILSLLMLVAMLVVYLRACGMDMHDDMVKMLHINNSKNLKKRGEKNG